jgi:CubicO group peptidase (beta-lactamase class C family)
MKKQLALLSFCVTLLFGCGLLNDKKEQVEFSSEKKQDLEHFFQRVRQSLTLPAVAMAVVADNQVYYNAEGQLRVGAQAIVSDTTSFFTGNLSELMVATVIMKMAESGKIKLDDPVVKHLPYFHLKQGHQSITIRHLLTQTGGIPVHGVLWDTPSIEKNALEATTRSINDQMPEVIPAGSKVKRSPYNFDILADLIQKVSGTTFEEYAKQHVFQPLDMESSSFYKLELDFNKLAKPHSVANWLTYETSPVNEYPYNREHAGSIGLHSSIKDLSKWMFMLVNEGKTPKGRFLTKELHDELMKVQFRTGQDRAIGSGWEIQSTDGKNVFRKSHQIGGFSAAIAIIPEENVGALILSNVASDDFNAGSLTNNLLWGLTGNKLPEVKMPVNIAMGKVYQRTNNIDSAIKSYTLLKQQQPNKYDFGVESLSQLGVNLLFRVNKPEDGLKVLQFTAEQYPASAFAQVGLAEAYAINKQSDKAKAALAKAKSLNAKEKEPIISDRIAFVDTALNKQQQALASQATN